MNLQRAVPVLAFVLIGLPVVAGLWETLRASFGVLPALGFAEYSLAPWQTLAALPGIGTSVRLSLVTGGGATLLSLLVAFGLSSLLWNRVGAQPAGRLLAPLLAAPHAALAIGLAFVLAPSGLIGRAVAQALGWSVPAQVALVQDPFGLALVLGLAIKETAFLTLVLLSAYAGLPLARTMAAGRALGYSPTQVWARLVWPQAYARIRLPVLVVLVYSISVVDVAMILGPGTPPTLSVAMLRWFTAADVALMLPASAAAMGLVAIIIAACGLWLGGEVLVARLGRAVLMRGVRRRASFLPGGVVGLVLLALAFAAGLVLALWSVAFRWPFPALLPQAVTLQGWSATAGWGPALGHTLVLAGASTGIGLVLAILWLEAEDRRAQRSAWANVLIWLPLLVPQPAFLYGLNVVALRAGLSGGWAVVIWGHVLMVFPYMMIVLTGPWRRLDPALPRAAATLGAGPWRRLLGVKLPVLLRPVMVAAAIGASVSVAQYLPTLMLGAGRIPTLTTEAVALASGGDRRITAVHALLQMLVPLVGFMLAVLIPALAHRNRQGLSGGAT